MELGSENLSSKRAYRKLKMATVLMVAEKPSLAASIASHLSAGRVSGHCLETAVFTLPWFP